MFRLITLGVVGFYLLVFAGILIAGLTDVNWYSVALVGLAFVVGRTLPRRPVHRRSLWDRVTK